MGVSSILSSLRNNIVGQNSTPTNPSLPAKRTPIEIAQDTGPLASLGYDPLGFSTHAYPLDVVNNPEIGHYMLFYINVNNKTRFPYTEAETGIEVGEGSSTPIKKAAERVVYNEGTEKERSEVTSQAESPSFSLKFCSSNLYK